MIEYICKLAVILVDAFSFYCLDGRLYSINDKHPGGPFYAYGASSYRTKVFVFSHWNFAAPSPAMSNLEQSCCLFQD